MPAMTLTPQNVTNFIAWIDSLDPGFVGQCLRLGPTRVLVSVQCPDGIGVVALHQDQTLTADQDPITLQWTVTIT